jgi:hypothetical protein
MRPHQEIAEDFLAVAHPAGFYIREPGVDIAKQRLAPLLMTRQAARVDFYASQSEAHLRLFFFHFNLNDVFVSPRVARSQVYKPRKRKYKISDCSTVEFTL